MKVFTLLSIFLIINFSIAKTKQIQKDNKITSKGESISKNKNKKRGVELIEKDESLQRSLSLMRDKEKSRINNFFMNLRNTLYKKMKEFTNKRKEIMSKYKRETDKYYELKKENNTLL